jgi:heterodisulfide reductase subunit C/quinone-modifying oxidoreductase subunit QmoC
MVPPSGRRVIRVYPSLAGEIRKYGKFGEVCYSCGTCTLSCDLTTDEAPFPRRPVQYAVLGLKEPLLESLEPWLCHDCGDCSTICPQQAGPRETMATLRRYLTGQYDWTGLSAKIYQSRAWAMGSLAGAGLLVVFLMVFYHYSVVGMSLSDLTSQSMGLTHMFPTITYFTLAVIFLPWVFLISNAVRMHRFTMGGKAGAGIPPSLYLSEVKTLLYHVVTQERMRKCPEKTHKARHIKHWMIAAGCFLILVLLVFFLRFFQTDDIHPIYHPQRWLGYIATVFLLYGTVDILIGRLEKKEEIFKNSEPEDYTFPVLLLLVTVSGIAVHILRYTGLSFAAHSMYLAHMAISVPFLVIEVPFGKCSHMIYRPLAIYFQSVKERASGRETRKEGLEAA